MLLKKTIGLWSLLWAITLIAMSSAHAATTDIGACGTFGAGSYVLAGNLNSLGITCLKFTSGPVTLDFNGFTLAGTGNTNGVFASGVGNVTVRNGTVKGFARGVYATGSGAVIDDVRAVSGSLNGFTVGDYGTVRNSLVTGHAIGAIVAGKNATIVGNTISGTAGQLIIVSDGSLVKGNTVTQNSAVAQSYAIYVGQNCKVLDNVISSGVSHPSAGIVAADHSLISGNTVSGFQVGINASLSNIITGNNASDNGNGIQCGGGCVLTGNTCNDSSGSGASGGIGISSGFGSQVLNNVANSNNTIGLSLFPNSSVIGNVAYSNFDAGLSIACPSKVADNMALGNSPNLSESGAGCLNSGNLVP